jgi:histidyl-tRNA synthetase
MDFQTLKGFRDIGPTDLQLRNAVIAKSEALVQKYSFVPIVTPALEQAGLLLGKYGTEEKLIYKFRDQGDRDVALRYDLTVPLARYISNNRGKLNFPFKRYQIGNVWRAEKPQQGRYREFVQFDADIVGSTSPIADAEVISMISDWLDDLGMKFKIKVNDRTILDAVIEKMGLDSKDAKTIYIAIDKLGKASADAVLKEIQTKGVKVTESMSKFLEWDQGDIGAFAGFVKDKKVLDRLKSVMSHAEKLGAKDLIFDPRLARGLDYYTSTIFEASVDDYGNIGSVAAGGRYDHMISEMAGGEFEAVGMTFGIDRIVEVLKKEDHTLLDESTDITILNLEESMLDEYLDIANALRKHDLHVSIMYEVRPIAKQLDRVNKAGTAKVLIYGQQEKAKGIYVLKDMRTSKQQEFSSLSEVAVNVGN